MSGKDSRRRRKTDAQLIRLSTSDVELKWSLPRENKVPKVCRLLQITEQTYSVGVRSTVGCSRRWLKELKSLQKENARLKKSVAEQTLGMEILKEATKRTW